MFYTGDVVEFEYTNKLEVGTIVGTSPNCIGGKLTLLVKLINPTVDLVGGLITHVELYTNSITRTISKNTDRTRTCCVATNTNPHRSSETV